MCSFIGGARAVARIRGGSLAPNLFGEVRFYQRHRGVLVVADISNLPQDGGSGFFALHVHTGGSCSGEEFGDTGGHYNPTGALHPLHAGDLPPLMLSDGGAFLAVMTDRFSIEEIIGRTVVIHDGADDFRSQPSGNAGRKMACGVIERR